MSYDQVWSLAHYGHIRRFSQMTHRNLAYLKRDQARTELAKSQLHPERELKASIRHFRYPCPALSPHRNQQTVAQSRSVID